MYGDRHPQHGVTIMETMVVIGVMMTIMVLLSQIFISTYDVYAKQTARVEAETGTVFVTRAISELARGATQVLASQTVNGTDYVTSSTTLVLQMPSIDGDGDIIDSSYDIIVFAPHATDPDAIITDTDAADGSARFDGQRVITENNDVMTFRFNAPDAEDATRVSVLLINSVTVRSQTFETPAWTSISLRNQ